MTRFCLISHDHTGAGASTLAAALADHLAEGGTSTALIDLDSGRAGIVPFIDEDALLPRSDISHAPIIDRLGSDGGLDAEQLLPFLGRSSGGAGVICPLGERPIDLDHGRAVDLVELASAHADVVIVDVGGYGGARHRALTAALTETASIMVTVDPARPEVADAVSVVRGNAPSADGLPLANCRALAGDHSLCSRKLPDEVRAQLQDIARHVSLAASFAGADRGATSPPSDAPATRARWGSHGRSRHARAGRRAATRLMVVVALVALAAVAVHGLLPSGGGAPADAVAAQSSIVERPGSADVRANPIVVRRSRPGADPRSRRSAPRVRATTTARRSVPVGSPDRAATVRRSAPVVAGSAAAEFLP